MSSFLNIKGVDCFSVLLFNDKSPVVKGPGCKTIHHGLIYTFKATPESHA